MSEDHARRPRRGRPADDDLTEDPDGPSGESAGSEPEPARTKAEEMGIPPLWAVSGGSGPKAKELKKQLAAAEEAVEVARAQERDAREQYVRMAAELENIKRRHRQDRQDQLLYGNAELITRILPLLDNFHRALEHVPAVAVEDPEVKAWVNGLLMVVRQFEDILEGAGVEPIESVGQKFDPNLHQAVMAEASEEHPEDHVIQELQKGYRLRDRVLRPSMVKVARNP
jgi:molecular chaperone GrpE